MGKENLHSILSRYFSGNLSKKFQNLVALWLTMDDHRELKARAMDELWDHASSYSMPLPDEGRMERKINERIDAIEEQERDRFIKRRRLRYIAAASIFVAVVGTAWVVASMITSQQSEYLQCIVPNGKKATVSLSDGSTVILNGGTRLLYPKKFNRWTNRMVYVSGEAHFDVEKNSRRPFIVNVENLSVTVLGTHFNIRAYPEEEKIITSLEEGSVRVDVDNKTVTLKPNEVAEYSKLTWGLVKKTAQTNDMRLWTEGMLVFDDLPLSQVLHRLSHHYGVRFEVSPEVNLERRCTMRFDSTESINNVIYIMSAINPDIICTKKNKNTIVLRRKEGAR